MYRLAQAKMPIMSADVSKAYLQAMASRPGVLLKPPKEAGLPKGKLWLSTSEKYGEPGAAAGFYTQLRDTILNVCNDMEGVDITPCEIEPCTYILTHNGKFAGALNTTVDDICAGGFDLMRKILDKIAERFPFGKLQINVFEHCGVWYERHANGDIYQHQNPYILGLEPVMLRNYEKRDKYDPVDVEEEMAMRKLVGGLSWVTMRTRGDGAVQVNWLQSSLHKCKVHHVLTANKLVRFLQGSPQVQIRYPGGGIPNARVTGIMDAAVGNREDNYSQGGTMVCITNSKCARNSECVPISWKSRKIPTICETSTEAETKQSVHCRKMTLCVNDLMHAMVDACSDEEGLKEEPACVYGDCEDLVSHVYSLRMAMKDKTLLRAVLAMRGKLADTTRDGLRHFTWIDGKDNPVDALTKDNKGTRTLLTKMFMGRVSLPLPIAMRATRFVRHKQEVSKKKRR
jgi:hypothetical protein